MCVGCWYDAKAGLGGGAGAFAFRPDAPTGHYQRHLDLCTGISMNDQLTWRHRVDVPEHAQYDEPRAPHLVLVSAPREVLNDEVVEDPSILNRASGTQWPPSYYAKPTVRASAQVVAPLALYLDGAPSTQRDGVL